jgi:hypothetical protein
MTARRVFAWVFALIAWSLPVPALAADGADDTRAEAKAAFQAGQASFEARDYTQALAQFRRAFDLHRHDAVRFNIAVCLQRLGRNREALIEYERAAKSEQLSEADRARAANEADLARKKLGTLVVSGTDGAEVIVDGVQLCNIPCDERLDPARHEVVVRNRLGEERRIVSITRQETRRISVVLGATNGGGSEAPAAIPVRTEPSPASPAAESRHGPGWLTWTGAGLLVIGGVGTTVFGLQAKKQHDDWVETGDPSAKDAGVRARNLTNVSIGVAVVGAVAVVVDLFVLGKKSDAAPVTGARRVGPRRLGFEF